MTQRRYLSLPILNSQVSDFGLSVAISEKPERMLLNSVCWAAPEKIQAVPGYDPKAADVYRSASAPSPLLAILNSIKDSSKLKHTWPRCKVYIRKR